MGKQKKKASRTWENWIDSGVILKDAVDEIVITPNVNPEMIGN